MKDPNLTFEELGEFSRKARRDGNKIALCTGCFDVVHDGHRALFGKARSLGDIVIVGIAPDSYVRDVKGEGRPKHSCAERTGHVLDTELVDYIFVLPYNKEVRNTYQMLYDKLRPDVVVTSDDEKLPIKKERASEFGIPVVAIKKTHSSSAIISGQK